jgi:transposase
MEDVLRLYAKKQNDAEPVVCLDERPVQLLDPARRGLPMRRGVPARADYEYVRRGTANIFCVVEPLTGRRLTTATSKRAGSDFARMLAKIARRYSAARVIHLVVDNLSTHSERCIKAALGDEEGRALWRRFRVHFTPKHGSWLNAAEMEVSLVSRECLGGRRIGDLETLQREVRAWSRCADQQRRRIEWKFRVGDARRTFRYDGITTSRSKD